MSATSIILSLNIFFLYITISMRLSPAPFALSLLLLLLSQISDVIDCRSYSHSFRHIHMITGGLVIASTLPLLRVMISLMSI
jgi:hypothetical protein